MGFKGWTNSQANKWLWCCQLESLSVLIMPSFSLTSFQTNLNFLLSRQLWKICIQRDIFTQWETGPYKQWQTRSWIKHLAAPLGECSSCWSTSPLGFLLNFFFFFQENIWLICVWYKRGLEICACGKTRRQKNGTLRLALTVSLRVSHLDQ